MSPVTPNVGRVGPRVFDPRHLSALELWLADFTLPDVPGGDSLGLGDDWPGAPALGDYPGSPADGVWSADPADSAWSVRDDTPAISGITLHPWIAGARGIARGRNDAGDVAYLELVDAGTTDPRTITLGGQLTFVGLIRNPFAASIAMLDDGEMVPSPTGLYTSEDLFQVDIGEEFATVSSDVPELDASDDGNVLLVMLCRTEANAWRCWVNGQERTVSAVLAGDLVIKSAFSTIGPTIALEASNLLLYSADHSAHAADFAEYFVDQFGVPAP